ncbi:MAG: hypothetical protein ACON35_04840 [Candidatus Marinamargulisbacteria bacterium]
MKVSERPLKRRTDSKSGNNQRKIRKLKYTGRLDYDGHISFALSPVHRRKPRGLYSLPHSPILPFTATSFVASSSSAQVMRDCKRSSISQSPEPFGVASESGSPKHIFHSPIRAKIKIHNDVEPMPGRSACSVRIPASSFDSPPRSPKETTQGTPPRSNQGGLTTNGKNKTVYIDQINKTVTKIPYSLENPKSIHDLKEIIYDIYREFEEGKILAHDLNRLGVNVTLNKKTQQIPVTVLPLRLIKNLEFTQTLVEMNIPGTTPEENKALKLDLCQKIVMQLYNGSKGCYIPFDIKPDNIGFDIDGENKITAVQIFDWSFPTKMLDETVEGIAFELKNHCRKVLGISDTNADKILNNYIKAIQHQTKLLKPTSGASSSTALRRSETTHKSDSFAAFFKNNKTLIESFFDRVNEMEYPFLNTEFGYKVLKKDIIDKPSVAQFVLKNKR